MLKERNAGFAKGWFVIGNNGTDTKPSTAKKQQEAGEGKVGWAGLGIKLGSSRLQGKGSADSAISSNLDLFF